MALLHQRTADVLADVVPDKNQRGKIAAAKFPKRPPNLRTRAERNNIAPTRPIVDEGLTISKLTIACFESVSEEDFTDGSPVDVMDLALGHPWSLSLPKLSLWKSVNRHPASGGKKPAVELQSATKTLIARPHESNGEISHMDGISRIVSLACRRRSGGGQETITESAQL
jgi:hypothetical protein